MSYRTPGERPPPPAVQTWESTRKCVDCESLLFGASRDGITIFGCGACGGIWLSNGDAHNLFLTQNMNVIALADAAARRATAERPARSSDRRCPDCAVLLAESQAKTVGSAYVIVDVCATHGTWFDKNELRIIFRSRIGTTHTSDEDVVDYVFQLFKRA
jgi:Zn-finger nucleic acid-binding protein